jgi:t-SNARE complex subunit (syntaxin)
MISNDEFYRAMEQKFSNVFKRMDTLHKETQQEIEGIKEEVHELKRQTDAHIAVSEALKELKQTKTLSTRMRITIVCAIVPAIIALFTLGVRL